MTGLNLGCGTRIFKSSPEMQWTNLDIADGPGVDLVADWRTLNLYDRTPNGIFPKEFDVIVAHHTFEHQGCGDQPVEHCYRILKAGGSLIVSVPDLRKLAKMWLSGELTTQIYMTNIYGPYDGTEASRHKWGFDETSLALALAVPDAPWRQIKPFNWRPIPGADIARDDRWILCLEAVK